MSVNYLEGSLIVFLPEDMSLLSEGKIDFLGTGADTFFMICFFKSQSIV